MIAHFKRNFPFSAIDKHTLLDNGRSSEEHVFGCQTLLGPQGKSNPFIQSQASDLLMLVNRSNCLFGNILNSVDLTVVMSLNDNSSVW